MDTSHLKMDENHEIAHVKLEQVKVNETLEKVICFIILQLNYANIELTMNTMILPRLYVELVIIYEVDIE